VVVIQFVHSQLQIQHMSVHLLVFLLQCKAVLFIVLCHVRLTLVSILSTVFFGRARCVLQ